MRILAVETSCDDSAVALLEEGRTVAEFIHTQQIHSIHGGVVPELASRNHMEVLPGLVRKALEVARWKLRDVDVFAATAGPGLVGSLLVGLSWTKAAAWGSGGRFLGINHLAAHIHTHYTGPDSVEFPATVLLVSGGHTILFSMTGWDRIRLLGSTRDDAVGEAFDKTAKIAGLGYPGGAILDEMASRGDPHNIALPSPLPDPSNPEFSFSGLKTAVRLLWERGADIYDLAASFRSTVVEILVSKLLYQARELGSKTVLAAGGVTANSLLRSRLTEECSGIGLKLLLPQKRYATDNAVMVGKAAEAVLQFNPDASSSLGCNAFARWSDSVLKTLCCNR